MNGINETDMKRSNDHDAEISYIRFDPQSNNSTSSTIVLSSCSSDDEKEQKSSKPPLRWKRQKILNSDQQNTLNERVSSANETLTNMYMDRSFTISTKENIAVPSDDERRTLPPRRLPPIPADKLHRRNPHTVRQEIKMFDDVVPDTTLADLHLNEMPGLHNTEQWKRIADRTVHASPPLSRQYYQTVIPTLEIQNAQIPQALISYRRPGRSENEEDRPTTPNTRSRAPRRRMFIGSSVAAVLVAIVVAVVLAVTLVKKTGQTTTDYYSGSVSVRAAFDRLLFDPSSTKSKAYKKDFCSLIGTTLADTKTKYALYYSTCSVTGFRNGSIIAYFVLGFTRYQNVTRLSSYLNRTLVNKPLFGGFILSIKFNKDNNSNSTDSDDDDNKSTSGKFIMTEQNSSNDQQEPSRTTYTTVTYTKLDTGLSITISETITITNTNDKSPINTKNYELVLVPSIENTTKTIVIPTGEVNDKSISSPIPISISQVSPPLPPPPPSLLPSTTTTASATATRVTKSPSHHQFLHPPRPNRESNFAYIDESSDEPTFSSDDVTSTLDDLTTRDSSTTSSSSTLSLNDQTVLNSTSTLVNNRTLSTKETPTRPLTTTNIRSITKSKDDSKEDKHLYYARSNYNSFQRQRRTGALPKNHRRLLQYELMPTGKVYYVDRPFYKDYHQGEQDENSSAILSTILSRSSSLDTLSEKHSRHRRQQQQQNNQKIYQDLSLRKVEQKGSIGGRLASNTNLPISTSTFKPITSNKKKRFSSFEPTPESLDRVFDVLIAADKRREGHEFWKEKFVDQRPINSRLPSGSNRLSTDLSNTNTNSIPRSKLTPLNPNTLPTNFDHRSQSYTNKRTSSYDTSNQFSSNLLEDSLRRRTQLLQQQRNYSPNAIYSTNYPKQQQLFPASKPPIPPPLPPPIAPTTTNQQPVRILPLSNGRIGRAPQARQTSDELSTVSDVWAARSSIDEPPHRPKKLPNHTRFQSTVNRSRLTDSKVIVNKRASSVEQDKSTRTQTKHFSATKNKFFDLFKFNR